MIKKMIIYIFLIGMFFISIQSISAANISVYPGSSIQDAVNHASNGDNITVYGNNSAPYTYKESVTINKTVNIKASGNVTIEADNSNDAVFTVNNGGSGSAIQNFTLSDSSYCIVINSADNCFISNNIINAASLVGIQFYGNMDNSQVIGNIINGVSPTVGNGISFEYGTATYNNITGNTINNFLNGILFNNDSEYNIISNNIVRSTGFTGAGIYATDDSNNMHILGNTVTGARDAISIQQMGKNTATNYTISGNTVIDNVNGLWVVISNSTISNNIANSDSTSGLDITGRYNNVTNNNASNDGNCGITLGELTAADYNNVSGNTLDNNLAGINSASNYSTISDNIITSNSNEGIISTTNNANIEGNDIENTNGSAIFLIGTYNSVTNNILKNNVMGLCMQQSTNADYNIVSFNNITYNGNGINSASPYSNFTSNNLSYNNDTGLTITGINCNVIGNNLSYNKVCGLHITSTGNIVMGNTLYNNLYGASFSNYNAATFNLNSVIGNTYQLYSPDTSGTLNAQNNWWGSNSTPTNIYGYFNFNPWIVLEVSSSSSQINKGSTSTITADLTHNINGAVTSLLYPVGYLPDGITVTFSNDSLGSVSPSVNTTTNGTSSTIFTGNSPGNSVVSVTVGSQKFLTGVTIVSALTPTAVTVNPVSGYKGDNVNLVVTLKDLMNNLIANKTIKFTVNGNLIGTETTNSQGIETLPYTITQNTGTYIVLAQFTGDNTYTASNSTNNLQVNSTPTAITINPITGYNGETVNLTSTLTDTHNNIPINGKTIQYTINGTTIGTATTNTQGIATLTYTITQNTGTYTIKVQFLQDNVYMGATNSQNLTVDNSIPTVSITNPGGSYTTSTTVVLKMNEPGTIYYTLNGTNPTTSSSKYASPIVISSNKTLKYFAVNLAGNKSQIYSQTYIIHNVVSKVASKVPLTVAPTSLTNLKTGVTKTNTLEIKFPTNIKASTNYKEITVKNITTNKYVKISVTIIGNVLYIKDSLNRIANDWYVITIPKSAIQNLTGNNLISTYTFKFKVV
jgi:parallel beta-helix repeat protein